MSSNHSPARTESLRAAALKAFPACAALETVPLGQSVADAWRALARAAKVDLHTLARELARVLSLEVAVNLRDAEAAATRLIPERAAIDTLVLPLREEGGHVVVATALPAPGGESLRRIRFLIDRPLKVQVAPPDELEVAIRSAYHREAERQSQSPGTLHLTQDRNASLPDEDNAVVRLAQGLFLNAIAERASDLHFQPFLGGGLVRIRVDGVLRRLAFLPSAVMESVVRYVKAQSGMDPTNTRVAQDGRMSLILERREIDLRISSLPANRGESLVIRLLDQGRAFRLGNAGFASATLLALRRFASLSSGIVLVTGPTGSGKSSTLYGLLEELNDVGVNIITIENPVEYRVAGIAQVEVNPKAGLTFASALRSILRQDPDVILVGEIRDAETAEIAMQAALTGHLVLTTLHTNDALSSIPRLSDLGIQDSIIADAVAGIVAQRLFRRLCERCRVPVADPLAADERLFADLTGERPAFRARGCEACGGTGFFGRFPVAEVVEMTPELASAIGGGEHDLRKLRRLSTGPLSSLSGTAAHRVISGDTSALEAARVIGHRFWSDLSEVFSRPLPAGAAQSMLQEESKGVGLSVLLYDVLQNHDWGIALANIGLNVHRVTDEVSARQVLQREGGTVLIIANLATGTGQDPLETLKRLRVALAWSRLPALIVVPEGSAATKVLEQFGALDYLEGQPAGEVVAARVRAILSR